MSPFTESDLKQYHALTQGAGIVDVSDRTQVIVSGADRVGFLNNLCTQNVTSLQCHQSAEAFFCSVQGKILAHAFVFSLADRILLDTVPEQGDLLMQHLDKYVIMESVEIEDATESLASFWVIGPDSETLLAALDQDEIDCSVFRTDAIGTPSSTVCVPMSFKSRMLDFLQTHGGVLCESPASQAVRIESKFPLFDVDIASNHLPQEVGRDEQAISFTKGCYLGQETVARIDALGHVNWQLVRLDFGSTIELQVGAEVHLAESKIGAVTSIGWSPANQGTIALARVRREMGHGQDVMVSGSIAKVRS